MSDAASHICRIPTEGIARCSTKARLFLRGQRLDDISVHDQRRNSLDWAAFSVCAPAPANPSRPAVGLPSFHFPHESQHVPALVRMAHGRSQPS